MSKKFPIATTAKVLSAMKDARIILDCPASEATNGECVGFDDSSLHLCIRNGLKRKFPNGLFTHQHRAIEHVLAGRHTVTSTRTSSGKSMTFALPAIDSICEAPQSTALFLYPQKALANDQFQKLIEIASLVPSLADAIKSNQELVSRYDGNTGVEDRRRIRDNVQLLVTNPDMLHLGILQHHGTNWGRFFGNLKLVAIDECHDYRGAFGSHVAMVLRRLREICRIHGSDPVFTASSATIADPQQHLQNLTGLKFELVGPHLDRSRQGRRKVWMVGSEAHHHDFGRQLAVRLVQAGLRVLAFCPSRVAAEEMIDRMRVSDAIPKDQSAVYRAGLSITQRAEIERGLQSGAKRLVFSTNALELGIDIGQLDVVICIGLPSTMMSLWQRVGRVARGGREGAIVLLPGNSPIDSYYSQRPAELLSRENEPIAININNEKIVCQHYACAIDEQGSQEDSVNVETLGPMAVKIRERRKRGEPCGFDDFVSNDPHGAVNLRSNGDHNYRLLCDGKEIGEIGTYHLLRETPRNAIYRHGGRTYRVQAIVRGERIVRLAEERTRNRTIPFIQKNILLRGLLKRMSFTDADVSVGKLEIAEYLESLTEKDPSGQTRNGWSRPGGMPTHRLRTEGTLVVLKKPIISTLNRRLGNRYPLAAPSAERLIAGLFPTVAGPCDPQDYSSGVLLTGERDIAIALYDTASGGIGLTETLFHNANDLIINAIDRVRTCECETDQGCIRCVVNPHQEAESSKKAALLLLQSLKTALASPPAELWITDGEESHGLNPSTRDCPECNRRVPGESRFCLNCGHNLEKSHG